MTDERSPTGNDSSISDAELIALLRKRLHDLEESVERYIEVMEATGQERLAALKPVIEALTTDFKTAILSSHDMTPEQRDHWLGEIEQADDASRPPADRTERA